MTYNERVMQQHSKTEYIKRFRDTTCTKEQREKQRNELVIWQSYDLSVLILDSN